MPTNARLCAALPLAALFMTTTALAGPTVREYRAETTQSAFVGPIFSGNPLLEIGGGDGSGDGGGGATKRGAPFVSAKWQVV